MSTLLLAGAVFGLVLAGGELWLLLGLLARNGRVPGRLEALERHITATSDMRRAAVPAPDPFEHLTSAPSPGDGLSTLLMLSMTTVRKDLIHRRWAREGRLPPGVAPPPSPAAEQPRTPMPKQHLRLVGNEVAPVYLQDESTAPGALAVFDWQTGHMAWHRSWGPRLWAPCGYCFADGVLYLIDSIGCAVLTLDICTEPGRLLRRISHPYLNDPHSLARTSRGFLISSAGTDLILELGMDGELLYEWWATEHGYTATRSGGTRTSGRGQEHRDQLYHTTLQSTHVNEAQFRDPEERFLLASFFHTGEIVQIDRSLPPAEQRAEVLLDGLRFPHGLRKTPFGWLVVNSGGGEIVLLDDDFRVTDRVPYPSSWIQDCAVLSSGDLVVNDGVRSRLVQLTGPPWRPVRVILYPELWRGHHLLEVPPEYQAGFRAAAEPVVTSVELAAQG